MLLLFVFLVPMVVRAQRVLDVGSTYAGTAVFCYSQKKAETIAKAYLARGDSKYFSKRKQRPYHVGTIVFTPLETTTVYVANHEHIFIVKALSSKMIYIVSKIPTDQYGPLRIRILKNTSTNLQ